MTTLWDRLAEQSRLYMVDDYERAAYRLVTAQVLSANEQSTRKDYHLIAENLREFRQALEPLGIAIRHSAEYRYVVAQPKHVLSKNKASKSVTLMVLVLADIYHRIRSAGQQGEYGEAIVELPDVQEAYQGLTGMDFPSKGEMRELMGEIERWGVIRTTDSENDPTQPYSIMLHPAIADVLTKEWLGQLEGLRKKSGQEEEEDEMDDDSEEASDVSAR
jgi:hypothetical protein